MEMVYGFRPRVTVPLLALRMEATRGASQQFREVPTSRELRTAMAYGLSVPVQVVFTPALMQGLPGLKVLLRAPLLWFLEMGFGGRGVRQVLTASPGPVLVLQFPEEPHILPTASFVHLRERAASMGLPGLRHRNQAVRQSPTVMESG